MNESAYGDGFRGHNLAATFDSKQKAEEAAERLSKSLKGAKVDIESKRESANVQEAEMREELEGVVAAPALGSALTKSQTQGAVGGAVLIGGVGVLIGIVAGFIVNGAPGSEITLVRWFMTWVLTPAIAAGTLGMLGGGLLKQRHDPAPEDSAPRREASPEPGLQRPERCVVQVSARDGDQLQEAIELLQQFDPERVDRFNTEGEVVETENLGGRANTQT